MELFQIIPSVVAFNDNTNGSAIRSEISSNTTFKTNCKVTFSNNSAQYGDHSGSGGAISCYSNSLISFEGESSAVFTNNIAYIGGAIFSVIDSHISFEATVSPVFSNNTAFVGGAIYSNDNIIFEENTSPVFTNNTVNNAGGGIYSDGNIPIKGNATPVFINNSAYSDGAMYIFIWHNF